MSIAVDAELLDVAISVIVLPGKSVKVDGITRTSDVPSDAGTPYILVGFVVLSNVNPSDEICVFSFEKLIKNDTF